ncbi:MAG: tryptophan-rich sensory protein [Alphaproteobacteria bacterium]|jgi:tryptophan-rich sensory protein|nr:tryptophan-rich sensory protein [Alphaproteobacteria bacterium]
MAWLAFAALCFAAALSGALFKPGAWHAALAKPSWHPPNWLFGPAWGVLYLMIATAGWMVWNAAGFSLPLAAWGVQLVLNAVWSWLFFGRRRPDLAFAEVLLLWLSIAACVVLFAPISATAALLMLPYLAWVAFASALNFAMWRLNRASPA